MAAVISVRVEHLDEPAGIAQDRPRLSWQVTGAPDGAEQTAYEIEYEPNDASPHRVRTASPASQFVGWSSLALAPRARVQVRVRVWVDGSDEPTAWSEPLVIERGLGPQDWTVDFASPSTGPMPHVVRPAYLMRAEFEVPADAVRVRAYSTAHGVYDLEVNGRPAGDDVLAPGWTSYGHRLVYRTVDLDDHVTPGANAIGAWLADGWYRGRLGFNGGLWDLYGEDVALLLQLEATRADGTVVHLPLQWRWTPAPITGTGLYEGEVHDQRLHTDGWSMAGFDDERWETATTVPRSAAVRIESPTAPPIRVVERLRPVAVERRANGRIRLDFGQNISGKLAITAHAPRGHTIELHHAEVLEHDELAVRPLRTASSVDRYTFAGDPEETWTPRFTIHGFRYAEVVGWPDDLEPTEAVEALVVHSDMTRRGHFDSSHALLNRFHENVVWSMRDNFVGLPTDCPQRDERLGWTGDIQVFTPAAAFLYDTTGVLQSWLNDLRDEQVEYGSVLNFHPWVDCGFPFDVSAGWGDAAVIVPWTLYQRTGDLALLSDNLQAMTSWIDQVDKLTRGTGHWDRGFQLGDWLDPEAPPERPGDSATDPYLVATAYHAHTARLVAETCRLLGRHDLVERYVQIAERARAAFQTEYLAPSGRVVSDTATAVALAVVFDLFVDERQRTNAGRRLSHLVKQGDHLIKTGFIGTPLVCDALAMTGHVDTAYHLLLQTRCPSWLYPVTMGATTVWERWDSMLPDGSVNPGEMTSFNHYALGAVVDFMHRVLGGLTPTEPGYRRIRVAPRPAGGLTRVAVSHASPHGPIDVSWTREGCNLRLEVNVPHGVDAEVVLPGDDEPRLVGSGQHRFTARFRRPTDDPRQPRLWNIHSPDDRRELRALTAEQDRKQAR